MAQRVCGQSYVEVTWEASHGAEYYKAAAEDKDGHDLHCMSNGTSCRLEGLMCSQMYTIGVSAADSYCTSRPTLADPVLTAPCPPSHVDASLNCADNSATLTWSTSPNAVSYTGKAMSDDGHTVTCDAGGDLSCQLSGLNCGTTYEFTVKASDGVCETPDSEPVSYTTAPCMVQSVDNTLDCNTNTLTTSWTPGDIPVNYSVTAMNENGMPLDCFTEDSSCTFSNLPCGQQYTVTVTPVSSTCEGQSSEPEVVNTVPCVPDNIRGVVECSSNTLQVSWDVTAGASSYVSTVTGAGDSASCPTTDLSCSFPDLQCAQTYSVEVEAVNDRCQSSETISIETAPCDPTNVAAVLDCGTRVATVSWEASDGADYYTVVAQASDYTDSCRSTSTSCELSQLMCGETYSVTVLAGDGTCNSTLLATTSVTTAPCAPVIDDYSLDCASNHALVSWIKDDDAVVVTVSATSQGHETSCSASTNSSCVLDDLQCGSTYTVQAVAEGQQCLSDPSSTFEIITAPCTPANVGYTYDCETGISFVNWDDSLGRKTFYVTAESGDHMQYCSTGQTDCSLSSLLCGRLYDVKVTAVADHCNSSQPGFVQIQTAPCSPHNISASLMCENNTGAVSWQHSPGAVSYEVIATARDGDVKKCQTNTTDCYIPHMHCAQTYVIVVTPYSDSCKGFESYPVNYVAGPCPPTDVAVSLQCVGNVGHVTWTVAPQGDLYLATATHPHDSHNHTCTSTGDGCSFTDLHCNEVAFVSVVTRDRGCWSEPSESVTFESVVCPPSTVTGVTTCSNNDITVSWDPSPRSGVTYFIHSEEAGGATNTFTTTETSHVISGLQCGQLYTYQVSVEYNGCTSVLSNSTMTETAPCPPTGLSAVADCGTNLGTLTWEASTHAISYTATVTGTNHDHVVSCTSNTTTCSVKLECGHQYSAVVVASSATCNSSVGDSLVFDSAPCLPEGVGATLDCQANTFDVQWTGSADSVGTYTAIAIGSDNTRATCDTQNTQCTIADLRCGMSYSIAVTAASIDCGTIDGSDYQIQSAPCKPEAVSVALVCSTHMASVTWQNSGPDQMDMVSAVDSRGTTHECSSTTSNCTFEQLTCGESYTISVVGEAETCTSDPASADVLNTAPCVPTHVIARVDCDTGITSVTWDPARGATSYTVFAHGNLGHYAECNSTDTNCNFPNLACGQDYNITVMARHSTCNSLISETTTATTGPCPHSNLEAVLDCDTNMVMASWTAGSGILYYNATATGFNVDHQQTCSTNGTSCNLPSLLCGESYRVTVSGQGRRCPSPAEEFQRVQAAPCPPTLLDVVSSCSSNDITVTWETSKGSVSYMAVAVNAEGQRWSCNTTGTSCQITNLPCGQHFEVYVAGLDEKCVGAKSNTEMIYTAPCVPENIQNYLDCPTGVLNITWESMGYAPHFRASVMSSSGDTTVCKTDQHYCVVPDMQCGQTFDVSVMAQDERCNSSYSPVQQVTTAPCPLTDYLTSVDCDTGVVSVSWTGGATAILYDVLAVDADGYQCNCSSTDTGCDLNMLKCGTEYSVTITPSRDGCVGRNSPTKQIQTVPCVPSLNDVEIDCLTNSAWVLGNASAGAEDYVVMATDSNGVVQEFPCNSTEDDMCTLPPLMCSMNFTFTLKARNQQCSSAASNAVKAETGPCSPQNISNSVDCDENTISIAWTPVPGAVSYTATLEHLNGNTTCCSTSENGCDIGDLPCGEMYILLVTTEGRTCNSSESRDIARTVPCIPQNLQASLSCSNNVASMSWNYSRGGQFFKVKAVSTDGHEDECSNFENQCDLTGLQCGKVYTATVVAEDSDCKSKPSDSVTIKTVPCTPEDISPVVKCKDNCLTVSWSESSGADSYIATISDSNGQMTTCQGMTEGSCNVTGLSCGVIYHVSVVASDGYCDSPPTPEEVTAPIPCEPRNIKAVMDCYTHTAIVTWYPSDGALSYNVTATSGSGHEVTCDTTMTHCEMNSLECGQSYHITVKAVGESCCRSADMEGYLDTGPCVPEHITTQYSLSIGQVLWDMANGADSYSVEAITAQGQQASCTTNDTYCPIYNMQCGQTYSVTVTAHNHVCSDGSMSTEMVDIETEPCPPNNVQTVVECENGVGVVTWEASVGAVAYSVSLAGRDGHSLTCENTETYCNVEGLHCGVVYYTNVIAVGETLNSSLSATVQLIAGVFHSSCSIPPYITLTS
ncbi:fibronectin-like [Sphaeramia orbicularis]|uniref:fibronectin-like n=1 Tax=Sphaeramia orbicularis TaxID=375764 RepID=UPI00118048D3|nr:fibronectin-like [Sphaeramia orbicularis]